MRSSSARSSWWQVRYRDDAGNQRKKNFVLKAGNDPNRHASAFDAKIRDQVNDNTYIAPEVCKVPFRDYAEQWRKDQLHHRPATAAQAEIRLRKHVYPYIGHKPLSSIRRSDIQRVVTTAAKTLAPSTIEVMYSYVVSVFKAAVADRVIAANPYTKIKRPAKSKTKVEPLTTEQVGLIASNVDGRYKAMVLIAAASGLRSGELRGLTVDRIAPALHIRSDVPPKQASLRIDRQLVGVDDENMPTFGPVKTPAADRTVPLGASAAKILVEHLTTYGPGLVFSDKRRAPMSRSMRAGSGALRQTA
jgi:integrase